MGPTGAGKTGVALGLAASLPVEIVSVDSAMVYRGLDIGSAKPTVAERSRIPHHLIDIRDPSEVYSAGHFVRDAMTAIEGILERGRTPLLVGGTMLYFNALVHGLAEMPEGDAEVRADIDAQAARDGWAALHAELTRVDPAAGARIHPNDPQRIQRALEVFRLSGSPISELQSLRRPALEDYDALQIVLAPSTRALLHARIEQRLRDMMDAGFLEEVRRLQARGDLRRELPALRAVGYRQLEGHLEGACSLDEGLRRAIVATRRLARRQLTWLRTLPDAHWIVSDDLAVALREVRRRVSEMPNIS
jgi:tRNA dimethylallyltransferase